ncbi:MAG: hypothetical protein ACLQVN_14735 [Bryobacteraceae bacterium]
MKQPIKVEALTKNYCAFPAVEGIDEGRIVAPGTARQIQRRAPAGSTIEIECSAPLSALDLPHPAPAAAATARRLGRRGIEISDIHIDRPSLEDAFIELTGKTLRE